MKNNKLSRRLWVFLKYFALTFFVVTISGVLIYKFLPVPFTPLMVQRSFEQAIGGKKMHIKHQWVPIEKISSNMILAAVAAEDNNFLLHRGFDFEAIEKAQKYNEKSKRIRGASTISQQTCKNVYLWLGRNYVRKGLEAYYTFLVETFWSKKRIMEVYLNSIEMGNGIFGIEAASQTYFKKHASQLTRAESAIIAASFPNPRKRNPAAPGSYLVNRQQLILNNMSKIEKVKF
jgi:monofunctional biosynthetic peptidoglycan transglycosylase